jgi:6-phosphogluconolactonase
MSEWHAFAADADLDKALAAHLARLLAADIDRHGYASLAVSGGSTPTGMFRQLSRCELDWRKVWLTLVDERCVATDHPDSNEQLVRKNLLCNAAAAARFVSLADARAAGPIELEQRVAAIPKPFSAVVLGMGSDGHTASWFPQATNLALLLDPQNSQEVAETDPVSAPYQRITLTLAAVLNSREIIIHITGAGKKAVLERAVAEAYPVAALLEQSATPATTWWAP